MFPLSIGLFVILIQSAFCEDLLRPCHTEDIACLSEVTENFLEKTSAGLPQFGIKPIDPIEIDELNVNVTGSGLVQLKNVSVKGLKKLKIKDFKIDTENRTVLLLMEANVCIEGDVNSTEGPDRLSGNTTVLVTASYNYDLKPNEKGDEYFTVGSEALVCDNKVVPTVSCSRRLFPCAADPEASENRFFCKIAEVVFHSNIFHNLRASAKLYPKTAFFTNI